MSDAMMDFTCPSPTMQGRIDRCGWFQHPHECSDRACAYVHEDTVTVRSGTSDSEVSDEEDETLYGLYGITRTTTPEDLFGPMTKEEPMTKPADPKLALLILDEEIIELEGKLEEARERVEEARERVQDVFSRLGEKRKDRDDLEKAIETIERLTQTEGDGA